MNEIKTVSLAKAASIIETRQPRGLFVTIEDDVFTAIDNNEGEAWTEDFEDVRDCIAWLIDEDYRTSEDDEDYSISEDAFRREERGL